jgi:hypothetical protein
VFRVRYEHHLHIKSKAIPVRDHRCIAAGSIRPMEIINDLTGNQTRDLPAFLRKSECVHVGLLSFIFVCLATS